MMRLKVSPTICHKCTSQILEPAITAQLNNIRSLFAKGTNDEELVKVIADIERTSGEVRELRIRQLEGYCPCRKYNEGPARFVHPKCPYQMEHIVFQDSKEATD
jgi:hypothetical protein